MRPFGVPDASVQYYCHCRSIITPIDKKQGWSLSSLYFCNDCRQLSCPSCVSSEPLCYYCPQCLFETATPSATVMAGLKKAAQDEVLKCSRSCLECPCCSCILSVVEEEVSPLKNSGHFILKCSYCAWDSVQSDLRFGKPTQLSQQLKVTEEASSKTLERFSNLLDFYVKSLKKQQHQPHVGLSSTRHAKRHLSPGVTSWRLICRDPSPTAAQDNSQGTSVSSSNRSSLNASPEPLASLSLEPERIRVIEFDQGKKVTDLNQRLEQMDSQPYHTKDLRPKRVSLIYKTLKRCPACLLILMKPETKASSTTFLIRHCAMDTLPHISLSRESLGEHEEYSLCIENSSSQSIELSLGIISQESPRDRINAVNSMDDIDAMGKVVKLGVPHLTLGPRFFEEEEEEEEREVDMEETKGHVKRVPLDNASPGIKILLGMTMSAAFLSAHSLQFQVQIQI